MIGGIMKYASFDTNQPTLCSYSIRRCTCLPTPTSGLAMNLQHTVRVPEIEPWSSSLSNSNGFSTKPYLRPVSTTGRRERGQRKGVTVVAPVCPTVPVRTNKQGSSGDQEAHFHILEPILVQWGFRVSIPSRGTVPPAVLGRNSIDPNISFITGKDPITDQRCGLVGSELAACDFGAVRIGQIDENDGTSLGKG